MDLSAHERKRVLQALLDSQGWSILEDILKAQVHTRKEGIILTPLEKADAVFAQEYAKGEVGGLELALAMPKLLLEEASEEVKEAQDKEPDDDEDSSYEGSSFDPEDFPG